MRKLTVVALAAVVALLALPALAQGGKEHGNIEQQIASLDDQFSQAFGKADVAFMEKYLADNYTGIHSDGKLSTKAQEIEHVKSSNLKWDYVKVRDRQIHSYGNMVVLVQLASSKGTLAGKPYSGEYNTTHVWVKRNGNWQIVAFQSTKVPESH